MAIDEMTIEILPDGTIKTETSKISGPNHSNAENFARFLADKTGGASTRTRRGHHHDHVHEHEHEKH